MEHANDGRQKGPLEATVGPGLSPLPSAALLNAFDDAHAALLDALELMEGDYETADIRQCLGDLHECRTHLRLPNAQLKLPAAPGEEPR